MRSFKNRWCEIARVVCVFTGSSLGKKFGWFQISLRGSDLSSGPCVSVMMVGSGDKKCPITSEDGMPHLWCWKVLLFEDTLRAVCSISVVPLLPFIAVLHIGAFLTHCRLQTNYLFFPVFWGRLLLCQVTPIIVHIINNISTCIVLVSLCETLKRNGKVGSNCSLA